MPTVHITTGLPASGKTTLARKLVTKAGGRMRRVNLDDLRAMLDSTSRGPRPFAASVEHETTVLAIQDAAINAAIDDGYDVVVDNTHLTSRVPQRIKDAIAGREVTFVVHDFTAVPIAECIRRDALRTNPVGKDAIHRLADRHAHATAGGWRLTPGWLNDTPPVKPYQPNTAMPPAVLCDIDGTLALKAPGRAPYDFTRCGEDEVNEPVWWALWSWMQAGEHRIVLLTGRGEEYRPQTEGWLRRLNVPYHELRMRPAGDTRRDDIVKAELFDAHVRHHYRVRVVLDDRDRVVALWRRMGLPTWQVNYGNF